MAYPDAMSDVSAMAWTLACALAGTALLWIPGVLSAHVLLPAGRSADGDDDGLHEVALAAAWGVAVVPSLCFFFFLLSGVWMSWTTLALTSALNVTTVIALLWRRGGWSAVQAPWSALRHTLRAEWTLIATLLAIALLYLLRHDDSLPALSCLHPAALKATGPGLRGGDLLRDAVYDVRLGNVGLVAAWDAMIGGFGYRWLLGICGGALSLGGFLLGRRIGASRPWGWFGLALLALNPWTLGFPRIDENLLTAAVAALTLPLLLRRGTNWLAAGALMGLLVTMRHVLILAVPAPLLLIWLGHQRRLGLVKFGAGFVAMTTMENLHHLLALGSPLRFESHGQFPAYAYQWLGLNFHWQGMLNWPLHDHVVRTPFNALPTFALWPLTLAAHFGLVLVALAAVGLAAGLMRRRRETFFWLLWAGPTWLALSLQEAWDYQNKMGVMVIILAAPVAFMLRGAVHLGQRKLPLGGAVMALSLAGLGLLPALRQWQPPADARYLQQYGLGGEEPAAVQVARDVATDVHLWPDLGRMTQFGRFFDRATPAALASGLRRPEGTSDRTSTGLVWGWHRDEVGDAGEAITIALDLSAPPWAGEDWIRLDPGQADVDLAVDPGVHLVQDLKSRWTRAPMTVALARPGGATAIQTFFGDQAGPGPGRQFTPCAWREHPCSCEFFADVSGLPVDSTCARSRALKATGSTLRIRTRAGVLSVVVTANVYGNRGWLWRGRISNDGVQLLAPVLLWHN